MARTSVIVLGLLIGVFLGVQLLNSDLYNTQMSGFKSFTTEDEYQKEFTDFMAKYKKSYKTQGEFSNRFQVFRTNYDWIEHTNSKNLTYKVKVNMFADLTNAEFKKLYTGKRQKPFMEQVNKAILQKFTNPIVEDDDDDFKEHFDWEEHGAVSKVKNQGMCGSCWAFSAIGAVEGRYAIDQKKNLTATDIDVKFSEQQLVDCARGDPRWPNYGCSGGEMFWAYNYQREHGICTDAEYPYTGRDGTCQQSKCDNGFKIKQYYNVTANSRQAFIKALDHGPMAVGICASLGMQFYFTGIMTYGCGTCQDHGVIATGYGIGKTFYGTDLEYVKIKNSWGTWWGESGYIRVGAHEKSGYGHCGIYYEPVQVESFDY